MRMRRIERMQGQLQLLVWDAQGRNPPARSRCFASSFSSRRAVVAWFSLYGLLGVHEPIERGIRPEVQEQSDL
jgi:hypothetical protein